MKKIALLVVGILASLYSLAQDQYVVLVSMDGFRWDYSSKYSTPTLDSIAKNGVKAKSLIPCFPSKTFPNHYSMATGLYPDNHGIVNNSFYAPEFNESFSLGNMKAKYDPKFYGGEPIWNTAEKQGVKTASFYWVGSEVAIGGMHPSIWKLYDASVSFRARVDSVAAWLNLPVKNRPKLILLYFQEPDGISHKTGPDSPETKAVVEELDGVIKYLCSKLNTLPIAKKINLILVSDHGMSATNPNKVVELSSVVKKEWVDQVQADNPAMNILAKPQYYDSVNMALKSLNHIKTWNKSDVPARLHYGKNPRTLDFFIVPDSTWSVTWKKRNRPDEFVGATHGYDPEFTEMHGIFYGIGPEFKKGVTVPSFENLNVYNIVARILGIKPAPNDGSPEVPDEVLIPMKRK